MFVDNAIQCNAILRVQESEPFPLSLIFMMSTAAASQEILAVDWRIFLEYYFRLHGAEPGVMITSQ